MGGHTQYGEFYNITDAAMSWLDNKAYYDLFATYRIKGLV